MKTLLRVICFDVDTKAIEFLSIYGDKFVKFQFFFEFYPYHKHYLIRDVTYHPGITGKSYQQHFIISSHTVLVTVSGN